MLGSQLLFTFHYGDYVGVFAVHNGAKPPKNTDFNWLRVKK